MIEKSRFQKLYDEEQSLKVQRDLKAVIDYAFNQGKKDVAKKLKIKGMKIDFIIDITDLTKEEIENL